MTWILHSVRNLASFYPFHSFTTDLLVICYILGIASGLEDTEVNKTEDIPVLLELIF